MILNSKGSDQLMCVSLVIQVVVYFVHVLLVPDVPVEKLSSMESLQSVNLKSNPLNEEVRVIARPLIKFDLLMSPKGAHAAPPQA